MADKKTTTHTGEHARADTHADAPHAAKQHAAPAAAPTAAQPESPTGNPTSDAVLILATIIEQMVATQPGLQGAATQIAAVKALLLPATQPTG